MKKTSLALTLLLLSALLLAACGGGGSAEQTPGVETFPTMPGTPAGDTGLGTPAGGDTLATPEVGGGDLGTPEAGAEETGIPVTGDDAMGTPTVEGTVEGTAEATTEPTGEAGGPGGDEFALLSDILRMSVTGQDGSQLGTVQGVVINSGAPAGGAVGTPEPADTTPTPSVGDGDGMTTGTPPAGGDGDGMTTETPSAGGGAGGGAADATETPAAGGGGAADATQTPSAGGVGDDDMTTPTADAGTGDGTAQVGGPEVAYILIEAPGDDTGTGATPEAETPEAGATPEAGTTPGDMDATGTPGASGGDAGGGNVGAGIDETLTPTEGAGDGAGMGTATPTTPTTGGEFIAIPWEAFATDELNGQAMGELPLNIDNDVLLGAPLFTEDMLGQMTLIDEYWADQGLGVPTTGEGGQQFLISGTVTGWDVTGSGGETLGQVSDFVVNLATGQIVYAVLSQSEAATGGQFYAVPMDNLTWQAGASGLATGAMGSTGSFTANFDAFALQSAPSATSASQFDWSDTSEIDTFWMNQGTTQ